MRGRAEPQNKGMKLTRPGIGGSGWAASQLIPGVRQTTRGGEERDEYNQRMPVDGTNG